MIIHYNYIIYAYIRIWHTKLLCFYLLDYIYGQLHCDLGYNIRVFFSNLSRCSDHMLSNKLWLYGPMPSIKDCLVIPPIAYLTWLPTY